MSEQEKWREDALCRGKDTNLFYPEINIKGGKKQIADVQAICRLCRVSSDCLAYAINNKEEFGIWGGLTTKDRLKITREHSVMTKEIASVFIRKYVNAKV